MPYGYTQNVRLSRKKHIFDTSLFYISPEKMYFAIISRTTLVNGRAILFL